MADPSPPRSGAVWNATRSHAIMGNPARMNTASTTSLPQVNAVPTTAVSRIPATSTAVRIPMNVVIRTMRGAPDPAAGQSADA